MKTKNRKFYIGLDIGTNSCGGAASDENHKIIKHKGIPMMCVRTFEEANTAESRRLKRSARNRFIRRRSRIELLRDLFYDPVSQIDSSFFPRLDASGLWAEDKGAIGKYSLFNDPSYKDKEFYKSYRTIYHLRKDIIENGTDDVRKLYLAVHHIIKYRGNFLYEGAFSAEKMGPQLFEELNIYLNEAEYGFSFSVHNFEAIEKIAQDSGLKLKERQKSFAEAFGLNDKISRKMIDAFCGASVKVSDIYNDESYKDIKQSFKFSVSAFEEESREINDLLGDDYVLIDYLKRIYDWIVLSRLTKGERYLSDAMIKTYEKHKADLSGLKKLIKDNFPDKIYKEVFKDVNNDSNYCAYAGMAKIEGKKVNVKKLNDKEAFYKYLLKILETKGEQLADNEFYNKVVKDIENGTFLPKITSTDNGSIPYQLNEIELIAMLDRVEGNFDFLSFKDDSGFSVKDKIIMLLKFRIPYYIGHINDAHKDTGTAWVVKKQNGKLTPWTFDKLVDKFKSAEAFIDRMISGCSYLNGEKVIPKCSLLYSEFMLLNELNSMKINNERLPYKLKKRLIEELFKKNKRVTIKQILNFLKTEIPLEGLTKDNITGIDTETASIKSSLSSYITFKSIVGGLIDERPEVIEQIIAWHTLFNEKAMVIDCIKRDYPGLFSEEQLKAIKGLQFKDFGRLSEKFLCGIKSTSKVTGAIESIIEVMRTESKNLNEIYFSDEYDFETQVKEYNADTEQETGYKAVDNLYLSPSVKRSTWQALQIVDEFVKAKGEAPDKIFVEVTRSGGKADKGKRTVSRLDSLKKLYESLKKDYTVLLNELNGKTESQLRGDRLYLYFTQLGRCAYTGQTICLDSLDSDLYDIDHIYPQAMIKDDSLDNRVLVLKKANADKKSAYLHEYMSKYITEDTRKRNREFWKILYDKKLISKEKYSRLTRNIPLSEDELAGFVNRQLVTTSQSAKAVIELLKQQYPETEIVYSKAGNVSDFRNKYGLLKCREINDMHHAKDAYLNIVVGNVFNTKYGHNAKEFFKYKYIKDRGYNPDNLFEYNIEGAWEADGGKSIGTVKKVMNSNHILVTKKAVTNKGEFYDETIYGKASGKNTANLIPLKGSKDSPLNNTERYGGYDSWKGAYFVVVEYDNKKKERERCFEQVPVMYAKDIGKSADKLISYFENTVGYSNVKILTGNKGKPLKIRSGSLLEIDGTRAYLNHRSVNKIVLSNANQWFASKEISDYVRLLSKFKEKFAAQLEETHTDIFLPSGLRSKKEKEIIARDKNAWLYDETIKQLSKALYSALPFKYYASRLSDSKGNFEALPTKQQAIVLLEIVKLLQAKLIKSNLSSIMEHGSNVGSITKSKKISNEIYLINQSVTGLYESRIRLSI